MKPVTVVLLLALLFCVALEVADAHYKGCPFNQHRCHVYCLSHGCKGGYCGGWFRLKCKCIGC
nr:myticofensin A1 [Mytilus coruscus]